MEKVGFAYTPFSHTAEYPGATEDEKWENFIKGLEELPTDIKVIGINDYFLGRPYSLLTQSATSSANCAIVPAIPYSPLLSDACTRVARG